jgi:putative inorganic carbon (hco3(-)) transporter
MERITSHFSPDAATWRFRGFVWQAGWEMAQDHALLGVGLDNFLGRYPDYMHEEAWAEPHLSHPHNLVLDFWLSTGLLGLAGAAWLVLRLMRDSLALWRAGPTPWLRAAGLGLAASTVDLVVHGSFDNSYFLVDLALLFWLTAALVAAQQRARQSAIIDESLATQ